MPYSIMILIQCIQYIILVYDIQYKILICYIEYIIITCDSQYMMLKCAYFTKYILSFMVNVNNVFAAKG